MLLRFQFAFFTLPIFLVAKCFYHVYKLLTIKNKKVVKMTEQEIINQLKEMVKEQGSAKVCVIVKLTDTRTLNSWLHREKIPKYRLDQVINILKRMKK